MIKSFRIMGWLEGLSFLFLLLVAVPLKYYGDNPAMVKVMGPIHGGLFLLYCASAFVLANYQEWPLKKHLLAYAAAVFPFGTFIFEKRYLNVAKA